MPGQIHQPPAGAALLQPPARHRAEQCNRTRATVVALCGNTLLQSVAGCPQGPLLQRGGGGACCGGR